jgi:hypothetical protein
MMVKLIISLFEKYISITGFDFCLLRKEIVERTLGGKLIKNK